MELKKIWICLILFAILTMMVTVIVVLRNPKMHQTLIIQKIVIEKVKKE